MKQKNLTGLRAGIYRETQSTRGQTLLELLSALLIFLALAAIFHTISGFSAMLWCRRIDVYCRCNHPAFPKDEAAAPHSAGGFAARCSVCAEHVIEQFWRSMEHAA